MATTSPKKQKEQKQLRNINKYARYSAMAFQMIGVILFGVWIGSLLDDYFTTEKPYFTVVFSLLAVTASCVLMIRDVQKLTKNE